MGHWSKTNPKSSGRSLPNFTYFYKPALVELKFICSGTHISLGLLDLLEANLVINQFRILETYLSEGMIFNEWRFLFSF